ncbi:phospholipase D family protein [Paenibacillus sp. CC-CFT747]|nr:phospholipase D family protein [Paenibacillus sp. CC-CFT747]
MSKFLGTKFAEKLLFSITRAKESLVVISPYISLKAAQELITKAPHNIMDKLLITLPPGPEYIFGSVEVDALRLLQMKGFELRALTNLHAKMYIIDKEVVYIGSANFTINGWCFNSRQGNIEEMTLLRINKKDYDHIINRYITPSQPLIITDEFIAELKHLIQDHNKEIEQYKSISKLLAGLGRSISVPESKAYYARYGQATKQYPYNFKYSLTRTTGEAIVSHQQNIQFNLGGSPKKSDACIIIPFEVIRRVLKKHISITA